MKIVKSINGLIMLNLNSTAEPVKPISDLNEIKNIIKTDSFVIAYLDYKVLVGRYTNGSFSFYDDEQIKLEFIQKMRIFNKTEELLLWRNAGSLIGRLRRDSEGEEVFAVDNEQVVFGTHSENLVDYSLLTEERGTELILPFNNLSVDEKRNRVKVKTRNYVEFNKIHQATYVDNRFVDFTNNDNKSLEEKLWVRTKKLCH